MHTLKIAVTDVSGAVGGYSSETVRRVLAERLHLLPELRRRVVRAPLHLGHPWWVDDPDFDLRRHLRHATVPPPGDQAALDALASRIASEPLARDHPLWEVWVAEGLADGRVAFITKIHHAVADGGRAAQMLAAMTSTDPGDVDPAPATEPWAPAPLPSWRRRLATGLGIVVAITAGVPALVVATVRRLRDLVAHRREGTSTSTAPFTGAQLPFNGSLTARRSFATAAMDFDRLVGAKRAHGVTVNDIVLAMVAGALRTYLEERDELPDRPLVVSVPVSTRAEGDQSANRVSNLFVSLPVHEPDVVDRVAAIHASTRGAKIQYDVLGPEMLADWSELTPARPYHAFMHWFSGRNLADRVRSPLNLVVSNVAGPREELFIAGARIDELYSVGPILEGIGLNVTVWSYLGRLYAGILGCPDQLGDLRRIADLLPEALGEIEVAAGSAAPSTPSTPSTPVDGGAVSAGVSRPSAGPDAPGPAGSGTPA